MENILRNLFDYQCIACSPELAAMIKDTESRYDADDELGDDELSMINAAGSTGMEWMRKKSSALGEDRTWKR